MLVLSQPRKEGAMKMAKPDTNRIESCCLRCRRPITGNRCSWCDHDDSSAVAALLPKRPQGPTLHADVPVAGADDAPDCYGHLVDLMQSLSCPPLPGHVMSELMKRSRDMCA